MGDAILNSKIAAEIKNVAKNIHINFEKGRDDELRHPTKCVIIDIIGKLQHILFPGYFECEYIKSHTLKDRMEMLLNDVSSDLITQIGIALQNDSKYESYPRNDLEQTAEDITVSFISKIPKIKEYLEFDIEAFFDGDPAAYSKSEIIISYPGLYTVMIHRIAHELYMLSVPLIPRIMTEHAHSVTGIDINPGAAIGKYFFIDHGTGIVIGETTEIGDHVKIYQGVTLGALSTKGGQALKNKKRHPTIKDNVTIYSGASILGGDTVIGENTVIGGNAFIVKSVPSNTLVRMKNVELQYKAGSELN